MKNNVTTRQLASKLHVTTIKVRRILRGFKNDKKYTRYSIPPTVQAKVRAKVVEIRTGVKKVAKKTVKHNSAAAA